ncbi:MAG: M13-type metalloendopeptidase [Corynebacterium sp.]|nr:M13-type metalloendopeptidase [Corynebacterium sp.]
MHDLFEEINGQWWRDHVIPADRASDGTFYTLRDTAEERAKQLAEADDGLVGGLYRSFMAAADTTTSDALAQLDPDFAVIDRALAAAETPAVGIAQAMGELDRIGVGAPAGFYVTKSADSDQAVAYISQSGLGLPDEAYYRAPEHAQVLEAYTAHVERMLELVGAASGAADVLAVETALAAGHWDVVANRDAVATFNPMELADLGPHVHTMFTAMGLPAGRVIVCQPSYLEHLEAQFTAITVPQWRAYLNWRILASRAAYLSDELSKANWEFYGKVLSGAQEQRARWKRALSFVEGGVGFELGKLYVAEYFPESSKQQMMELVSYLLGAYRERISVLTWMGPETRQKALDKLELFNPKIGYPEVWRSYDVTIGDNLVDNVRAVDAANHQFELDKLGKPADRTEWLMTPQTVNAYYMPVTNDITFPAAILEPPFFSPEASPAENFGAIGAVIGHEIGHGFDDQGSRYDGHGNLVSWWTDEDRAAFEERTSALVRQFDGLVPLALQAEADTEAAPTVNGQLTLGENIGDLGGLSIALTAYHRYADDHGEDVDLRSFFTAWALAWRTKTRPEMAAQLVAVDPHSPAEFRCSIIPKNIDEFYEAFDVDTPLPQAERVAIW